MSEDRYQTANSRTMKETVTSHNKKVLYSAILQTPYCVAVFLVFVNLRLILSRPDGCLQLVADGWNAEEWCRGSYARIPQLTHHAKQSIGQFQHLNW